MKGVKDSEMRGEARMGFSTLPRAES